MPDAAVLRSAPTYPKSREFRDL
ncbi:hypothetical protein THAOC_28613, partial [Thalassiosira oceanica]